MDQWTLIHETPWQNLIILDACRYDAFNQVYKQYLQGTLIKARSRASCTRLWLRETWTEDYHDTTYISCNMYMRQNLGEHEWQYPTPKKFKRIIDVWRKSLAPEDVEKHALIVKGRKILHYNYPHQPYCGEVKTLDWLGYISNLEYILKHIKRLLPKLRGLTIITADHGELILPAEIYHPCSKDDPRLREIPWFTVEGTS